MKYSKRVSGSLKDSFMAKFVINESTGCWDWTAATCDKGYGHLRKGGKDYRAHVLSYEFFKGPIPEGDDYHGVCVLHQCDRSGCVNPDHLFLGTNLENILDMRAKGRDSKGEERYNAKLTEEDVVNIKKDTRYQYLIAADYGINQSQVSRIKNSQRWRHTNRTEVASGR